MLPASNRGVGMSIGFPDVCNTIVGPATVPIPYPNIALNAQAAPFSPTVKVSMMPALNMGSTIPMTMGDELGTAHPTVKGAGRYTMGNPIVHVDGLPAINLTCPATGNNSNDALAAVLVPSAVNVFYCDATRGDAKGAAFGSRLVDDVGWVTLGAITADAPARMHGCVTDLVERGARSLVLDLRGNGGGELDAAIRLAEELLDAGATIATLVDADGDAQRVTARHPRTWSLPVVLLVDETTASAAEVFAAALADNARAVVVGTRTYGKGIATRAEAGDDGPVVSTTAMVEVRRPSGAPIHGVGIEPSLPGADDVERVAHVTAQRLTRG